MSSDLEELHYEIFNLTTSSCESWSESKIEKEVEKGSQKGPNIFEPEIA